jgi:CubicO group peptidase (beta-lactamase class C family)
MKHSILLSAIVLSLATTAHAQSLTQADRAQEIAERYAASPFAPPGFSIAIVDADGPLFVAGYGLANLDTGANVTPDTVFYNASVTKSFTALGILSLAEAGEVDINGSLWPLMGGEPEGNEATLTYRSLLTHNFGLEVEPLSIIPAFIRRPAPAEVFGFTRYAAAPREAGFSYTNQGYIIADAALAASRGEDFRDIVQDEVLSPLGMTSTYLRFTEIPDGDLATGYEVSTDGYASVPTKPDALLHAAGGMFTTANDAAIWLEALINDGAVDGEQRLPASLIETALTPQVDQTRSLGPLQRESYAFGWNVSTLNGERIYEHGGGFPGARAWVTFMPEQHLGIAVFANVGNGGNPYLVGMMTDLYGALLDEDWQAGSELEWLPQAERILESGWTSERAYLERQYALIDPNAAPDALSEFHGSYLADHNLAELVIAEESGKTIGRIGEIRIVFHPMADETQILGDAGLGYRTNLEAWPVERDGQGTPSTLVWQGITFTRQAAQ